MMLVPRDLCDLAEEVLRHVIVCRAQRIPLAAHMLELLRADPEIGEQPVSRLEIKVSSGAGQWAGAVWSNA